MPSSLCACLSIYRCTVLSCSGAFDATTTQSCLPLLPSFLLLLFAFFFVASLWSFASSRLSLAVFFFRSCCFLFLLPRFLFRLVSYSIRKQEGWKRGREGVEAQQRRLCVCWSGEEKEGEGGSVRRGVGNRERCAMLNGYRGGGGMRQRMWWMDWQTEQGKWR